MKRDWPGWRWVALAALGIALIAVGLRFASQMVGSRLKTELEQGLRDRFGSATVGSVQISLFPRVHATAKDVVVEQSGVRFDRADVSAGWFGLLSTPRRVGRVTLEGLRVDVDRGREKRSHGSVGKEWVIDEIIADGTQLRIIPKVKGKSPLEFDIYKLTLNSAGPGRAMKYRAELRNAKPPGVIHATGTFGPLITDDFGETPLTGEYTFRDADLGVFKGISGTLASTGKFEGVLGRIVADGTTDVPNFIVQSGGNPVHLKVQYHSVIDGTNGETLLEPVRAHFLKSDVECKGGIVETEGVKGKTVDLNCRVDKGRLEDMMVLATKTKEPMTGAIRFNTKLVIPPGDVEVMRKMRLDGKFDVDNARFGMAGVQSKVNELSGRASGNPEAGATKDVVSDLGGRFKMGGGVIGLQPVQFSVPGAFIQLSGTYDVPTEGLDFRGTARTNAKVSEMTTGVKSFFLKAVDPFFKKQGAGAVIPLRITGTRGKPSFGLK